MIQPEFYYLNSLKSWLNSSLTLSIFLLFLLLTLPLTAIESDNIVQLIYYTLLYSLMWILYDGHAIMKVSVNKQVLGISEVLWKLMNRYSLLLILNIFLIFLIINWKLGEHSNFDYSFELLKESFNFFLYFLASKLFISFVLIALSAVIWWKFILKRDAEVNELRNMLAYYIIIAFVFLSLSSLIQASDIIDNRGMLFNVLFANIFFVLFAIILSFLMKLSKNNIKKALEPSTIIEGDILFEDSRHHAKVTYLFASGIMASYIYFLINLPIALVLFVLLIIPAMFKK